MKGIDKTIYTIVKNTFSRNPEYDYSTDFGSELAIKLKPEEITKLEKIFVSDEYMQNSSILDDLNEDFLLDSMDSAIVKLNKEEKVDDNGYLTVVLENVCGDIEERTRDKIKKLSHKNKNNMRP